MYGDQQSKLSGQAASAYVYNIVGTDDSMICSIVHHSICIANYVYSMSNEQ